MQRPYPVNPHQIIAENLAPVAAQLMRADVGKVRISLRPVFSAMDDAMAASPVSVACKAGCDYCCHYHVQVSAAEAFALAEHVGRMPDAAQAALRNRLEATLKRVSLLSKAEYETTNIPCAFLQDGRCSVYAVRPSPCRGHHALDVAPCKRTFEDPASTAQRLLDPTWEGVQVGYRSALLLGHEHAGRDASVYEMHGAVHAALTNRAAFRRWKEGKVAFPEVRDRKTLAQEMAEAGK